MDFAQIQFSASEPGIAELTLNRPSALNAYTAQMCREILAALDAYMADDSLHCLIVTGAGRGFCSGGDIGDGDGDHSAYMARQLGHAMEMREGMQAVVARLHRLDKPVIAMVNGAAVAGGLTLALACDLRIAADTAKLGDTSGRFGLLPDEGGAWFFPRAMGLDHALKMTMLAETYSAADAMRLGLVTEAVPAAELRGRTFALARAITAKAPLAVRLAKMMMRQGLDSTLERSQNDAALSVMIANPTEDVREGVRAFHEKRQPEFRGR